MFDNKIELYPSGCRNLRRKALQCPGFSQNGQNQLSTIAFSSDARAENHHPPKPARPCHLQNVDDQYLPQSGQIAVVVQYQEVHMEVGIQVESNPAGIVQCSSLLDWAP